MIHTERLRDEVLTTRRYTNLRGLALPLLGSPGRKPIKL